MPTHDLSKNLFWYAIRLRPDAARHSVSRSYEVEYPFRISYSHVISGNFPGRELLRKIALGKHYRPRAPLGLIVGCWLEEELTQWLENLHERGVEDAVKGHLYLAMNGREADAVELDAIIGEDGHGEVFNERNPDEPEITAGADQPTLSVADYPLELGGRRLHSRRVQGFEVDL